MRIVVCVKQVPDPSKVDLKVDKHTLRVVREGVPNVMDPGDEVTLEGALRLAEATPDSQVTLVSMGPQSAVEPLRMGLAMGADAAVLVSDEALEGADAFVTARVLASVISTMPYDLIMTSTESSDASSGLVPGMLAGLLGVPHISLVRKLSMDNNSLGIERLTADGYQEVVSSTPALLTISSGAYTPRYPTLRGIMQAKNKPIKILSISEIGLSSDDLENIEEVIEIVEPQVKAEPQIITDINEGVERILTILTQRGLL